MLRELAWILHRQSVSHLPSAIFLPQVICMAVDSSIIHSFWSMQSREDAAILFNLTTSFVLFVLSPSLYILRVTVVGILDTGPGRSRAVTRSMEFGRCESVFMSLFLTQGGMNCGVVDGLHLDFLHKRLEASLPVTLMRLEKWKTT